MTPDDGHEDIRQLRRVLRAAVSVGLASGAYGVSFGALGTSSGLSVEQTCALSVLAFTGASQFAAVGVLAGGGNAVSASAAALLLGSRNALYAAGIASLLRLRGVRRVVGAQLVIDESTAVAIAQSGGRAAQLGFWATGLSVFLCWNLTTLLGALGGTALGDPRTFGLDAAAPAAFVALLAPRLRGRAAWWVAAVAALLALVLVPVAPTGVPVLAAALVPLAAGLSRRTAGRHTAGRRTAGR